VELPGLTTIVAAGILTASRMSGVGGRIFVALQCRQGYVGDNNHFAAREREGIHNAFCDSLSKL
jgi:hypothetical protein